MNCKCAWKTREAREESDVPETGQGFQGKLVRNGLRGYGCLMLGGFLTVKPGLQRESLVEEMTRRAWQEKGGAEPDGNKKRENTNNQKSGPHLVSGPT